jgi:hypothetical protein
MKPPRSTSNDISILHILAKIPAAGKKWPRKGVGTQALSGSLIPPVVMM